MTKKKIIDKLQTPKAVKWFWIILVSPVALIVLLLLLIRLGVFGKLPTFEELENPKSNLATEIYSEDGQMIGSFFVQNRSYVDYSELSPALVAALTSTEDMRFYSHSGIDFISLARVAVKTMALGNRNQGGGSTITQQLAKNLYPRDTAVYDNPVSKGSKLVISKLKEWITAVMLEYNYTKEEILTMYLNTVLYGSNAYGIKSAAHTFFNKTPDQINLQEAAMLVGVVNAKSSDSDAEGLGFAIPINDAIKVAQELLENGYVTGRPYLGITYLAVTDAQTAQQLGVNAYGVYIVDVTKGGPADQAGLKVGDRIVSVDGSEIAAKDDLGTLMQKHAAGDTLAITVARDGQMQTVNVTLGEKTASNS